jgi:hypothetical protein
MTGTLAFNEISVAILVSIRTVFENPVLNAEVVWKNTTARYGSVRTVVLNTPFKEMLKTAAPELI